MEFTDIEVIISAIVAFAGAMAAILKTTQYNTQKSKILEAMAATADFFGIIYADPEHRKQIEKLWTMWADVGPSFAEMLGQKQSFAQALDASEKATQPTQPPKEGV